MNLAIFLLSFTAALWYVRRLRWRQELCIAAVSALESESVRHEKSSKTKESDSELDLSQILTALIAHVKNGGTLRGYLEAATHRRCVTREVTVQSISEAFSRRCGSGSCDEESSSRVGIAEKGTRRAADMEDDAERARVSARVFICARLSESLGCALSDVVSVVLKLHLQERKVADLKAKASAIPKATLKLLSALPVVVLLGGEVLGAHGVAFLLFTAAGRWCLLGGLAFFAAGMVWSHRLLGDFQSASTGTRQRGD